jgi:NAD+ diphosphatase
VPVLLAGGTASIPADLTAVILGPMFLPALDPAGPPDATSVLVRVGTAGVAIRSGAPPEGAVFVGALDGRQCWAVDDAEAGPDTGALDLRRLWSEVDESTWAAAGRAVQLVEWARTHRFCGRCGASTHEVPGLRAKRCPRCGLEAFPRLSPAVICLVEREDGTALLARGPQFAARSYSCLAGFVEPGESLEEAVTREVREEVAIEVTAIRYFASQPWPFPHSLMIGFNAHWLSGEIEVDGTEITEAAWFSARKLPGLPPAISIARSLIDDWLARVGR